MLDRIKKEPAVMGAIASLIVAIVGVFIKNEALAGALAAVAITFLGLRQVVVPVAKAVETTTKAATEAAIEVVQTLDHTVIGTTGEVTDTAKEVVDSTVGKIIDRIFGRGK